MKYFKTRGNDYEKNITELLLKSNKKDYDKKIIKDIANCIQNFINDDLYINLNIENKLYKFIKNTIHNTVTKVNPIPLRANNVIGLKLSTEVERKALLENCSSPSSFESLPSYFELTIKKIDNSDDRKICSIIQPCPSSKS